MLPPLCSGILFLGNQDSQFINITIYVYVSLGIWILACALPTFDLKIPNVLSTFRTNFPKPIWVLH